MGYLYYGTDPQPTEIPDRILAHLRVVATTKLRRGESFTLTLRHPEGAAAGRTTIWMQPAIPLRFVFDRPESDAIDPAILKQFAESANSSAGLLIDMTDFEDASRLALVS